jgi:hypothetical protein
MDRDEYQDDGREAEQQDDLDLSFRWQDSLRACLGSFAGLACLPSTGSRSNSASASASPHTAQNGSSGSRNGQRTRIRSSESELARLLQEDDDDEPSGNGRERGEEDALSLHSNISPGSSFIRLRLQSQRRRRNRKGKKNGAFGRCFGYDLFGRRSGEGDEGRDTGVDGEMGEETSALPEINPSDIQEFTQPNGVYTPREGEDERRKPQTALSEFRIAELSTADSSKTIKATKARSSTLSSSSTSSQGHTEESGLSKEERRARRKARKAARQGFSSLDPSVSQPEGYGYPTHVVQEQYLPPQPMPYPYPYANQHPHPQFHPHTAEYGPFVQASQVRVEEEEEDGEMDFEAQSYARTERRTGADDNLGGSGSGSRTRSRTTKSYASRSSASETRSQALDSHPHAITTVSSHPTAGDEFEGFGGDLILPDHTPTTTPKAKAKLKSKSKSKSRSKSSKSSHASAYTNASTTSASSVVSPHSPTSATGLLPGLSVRIQEEGVGVVGAAGLGGEGEDDAERIHGLDFNEEDLRRMKEGMGAGY